jgi:hypothetical protein
VIGTCAGCKFHFLPANPAYKGFLECRRYPPITTVQFIIVKDAVNKNVEMTFNMVAPEWWCGEWKPKLEV